MSAECKLVTCCDLDDFPQTSSSEGNCPAGWHWDGVSCVRCPRPPAPSLTLSANLVTIDFEVEEDVLYQVQRFDDGQWMTIESNVGSGAGEQWLDVLVTPGSMYSYRISVAASAECGYIEGESASAVAI